MFRKKWWLLAALLIICLVVFYYVFANKPAGIDITAEVKKGNFKDIVVSPGELMAENTVYIQAPSGLQSNQIYEEIKIQDMAAEGITVKEGDYIATLDPAIVNKKIGDVQLELDRAITTLSQTSLDTTLQMRESRDAITNLNFQMDQKRLALELSKYEPPATIKQAELDLEKAQRDLTQLGEKYKIQTRQASAKMDQAAREVKRKQDQVTSLVELRDKFRITAPTKGLLVYIIDYSAGGKKKAGSAIRSWDPRLAMLPDLSSMMSKTYINEVDISKIKKDQKVTMGLDAFPEVKMNGIVTSVANIGENRPGSNAKVFEVLIKLEKVDSILKPGMTTSNNILINEVPNKIIIPLEAVFSEKVGDKTHSFVYQRRGNAIEKREVKLGKSNDEEVIVEKGLEPGDKVMMAEPASAKENKIVLLK
ncbi:HlyD family efflux transporter periplasmic adaptor subunit [Chitinophaga sp. SYP-B3965]|uniref:efflux RND transporter periplasmic adaptor subunit n=1 Tax=Chitinophaga sp. SYP-B3965 TaxID=2663120 RepID=UPI001299EBA1|nr:HlyD family secretion protein [Chitinophaga sp. SYP-B3965]MRG47605.1 HlyD family efflux transporter periplasmic adaptor subunit [Chitinophaga sp. SYP-B3965]